MTLYDAIPKDGHSGNDELLGRFLDYVSAKQLELYPAQEEAILELFAEKNVILNTPTGSGKSLVATALHFKRLAQGRRSVYTCPIKALVNEKFLALCREFGPDNVGMITGDATVNRDAPILCCTAEILANIALREGARANVRRRDHGRVPLLLGPRARRRVAGAAAHDAAGALSPDVGDARRDTTFFEEELTRLNGRETVTVASRDRPVPLEFSYAETPLAHDAGERCVAGGKAPVYLVHFTQNGRGAERAGFHEHRMSARATRRRPSRTALEGFKFSSPYGTEIKKWLRHGIGLHHAGLLPKYRVLVEQLAQHGLLKVICGTDTLGVGINVPIRTVLFTQLCKYDGQKTAILSVRDFHQISGRAGRKGFDDSGCVVAQAPEHVDRESAAGTRSGGRREEIREAQAAGEELRELGQEDLHAPRCAAPPEPLTRRFQVTHGMLLNVLSRPGDGCRAMRELIARSHETPQRRRRR